MFNTYRVNAFVKEWGKSRMPLYKTTADTIVHDFMRVKLEGYVYGIKTGKIIRPAKNNLKELFDLVLTNQTDEVKAFFTEAKFREIISVPLKTIVDFTLENSNQPNLENPTILCKEVREAETRIHSCFSKELAPKIDNMFINSPIYMNFIEDNLVPIIDCKINLKMDVRTFS